MATTSAEPVVYQFRYYGANSDKNVPDNNSWIGLSDDATKENNLLKTVGSAMKLGIQTLPGVVFNIGNNNFSTGIIIDHTGIYELDLRNTTTTINSLYFQPESLRRIDEVDNACIIVDVLCNSGSGASSI